MILYKKSTVTDELKDVENIPIEMKQSRKKKLKAKNSNEHQMKKNTPTGAWTNPKNFDLNKNLNLLGTLIILESGSI